MEKRLRALASFAREALKLERLTSAGRLNAFGMAIIFLVVTLGSVSNMVQVVVRIFDSDYTTGSASVVALVAIFGGYALLSVLIVGLLELAVERDDED